MSEAVLSNNDLKRPRYEVISKNVSNPINLYLGRDITYRKEMINDLENLGAIAMHGFGMDIINAKGERINQFESINDMFDYFYNKIPDDYIHKKADAPFTSTTSGIINPYFGEQIIPYYSLESIPVGIANKIPYQKEGFRANLTRLFPAASGAYTEGAAIPDSVNQTPVYIKVPLKTVAHAINWTHLVDIKSRFNDSVRVPASIKAQIIAEHVKTISEMLFIAPSVAQSTKVESWRRIIASNAELTAKSYTAGYADPWTEAVSNIDRDAGASAYDSIVSYAASNRDFTPALVDSMVQTLKTKVPEGYNPKDYVCITTHALLDSFAANFEPNRFFKNGDRIVASMNGIQRTGYETGFEVASYKDIVFIGVNDAAANEALFMNMKHIGLQYGLPTMVIDYGLNRGDPSGINFLGSESLVFTVLEAWADSYNVHGKIMNIQ